MNRKATVMLLICVISFIVAIILFYTNTPDVDSHDFFLGQAEIDVYETYQQGENCLYFLDLAAEISKTSDNFQSTFGSYLLEFNKVCSSEFTMDDFDITITDSSITVSSEKEITFEEERYTYKVKPYIHLETGEEAVF
tara:strand:- start:2145 stop:2558 length:414 start_codon:yes stop_codon:yes gene_type:complete